jgi:hypothetical protein
MSSRKNEKSLKREERVLLAFCKAAAAILPRTMEKTRCLNASRVTIETLKEFGISSLPVSVKAMYMNKVWYDLVHANEGFPHDEAERDEWIAKGGWCMAIDTKSRNSECYPGHVIVAVPTHTLLIDAAASQFSRPNHGVKVPEVLMIPISSPARMRGFLTGREQAAFSDDDGSAWAFYTARPDDRGYETAVGFQPHDGNLEVVGYITTMMKNMLTSYPD